MYKSILGIICFISIALSLHAQSPQEKGLQSINRTSAGAIINFLADDELQGREAGIFPQRLEPCQRKQLLIHTNNDTWF